MKNNTTTNNATINNNTINKEETVMKKNVKIQRAEVMISNAATITKVQDENYVTKVMLADMIGDIIGNTPSIKKHTRPELIEALKRLVDNHNNAMAAKVQAPIPVPVGDLNITHDNAPQEIIDDAQARKQKSDLCFSLIKAHALDNQKKGYGHTISAYMLCAYILQAGYGMEKLKGHESEVTDEMKDTVKTIRKYMLEKGLIKAVTYKSQDGKAYYTPEYDGNDDHKKRMSPISENTGVIITSTYKVQW